MIYIFDIDGTIANIKHRLHFIQNLWGVKGSIPDPKCNNFKPDWDAFFNACGDDAPIPEVIALLRELADHNTIIFITGRSDAIRDKTIAWLNWYVGFFHYESLYMRKAGDHRPDHIVKSELLDQILQFSPLDKILGVFEDRKPVVDMYRARGLQVYQVAEGDF